MRELDNRMDRALTGFRDGARAMAAGAAGDDPIHDLVATLLDAIFPAGVYAVTSLPYIDQLAGVEAIVDLLEGDLSQLVAALSLRPLAERLIRLAREYRTMLQSQPIRLAFAEVKDSRVTGQAFLLEIIAMILGTYHRHDSERHGQARAALLGPILEQNEAIRAYLRQRRPVLDIDPDTGEPEPGAEPGDPAGSEADEPASPGAESSEPAALARSA